jgi:hypothetical protein
MRAWVERGIETMLGTGGMMGGGFGMMWAGGLLWLLVVVVLILGIAALVKYLRS